MVDLLPYLKDKRYLRVDGRPMLLIYRPDHLPDCREAISAIRRSSAEHGIDICIAACLTFSYADAARDGFDIAVEFPPHSIPSPDVASRISWIEPFSGRAYDYDDLVTRYLSLPEPLFPTIRTAMVGFDNTARRGNEASIFVAPSPEAFESWLAALVNRSRRIDPPSRRLVFINAWNEWAEGNHLEPDQKYGRRWLRACARAVAAGVRQGELGSSSMSLSWARSEMARLTDAADGHGGVLRHAVEIMRSLDEHLRAAEATTGYLGRFHADWLRHVGRLDPRRPVATAELGQSGRLRRGIVRGHIEHPVATALPHHREDPLVVRGWIVDDEPASEEPLRCLVTLVRHDAGDVDSLSVLADYGLERRDVAEALFGTTVSGADRSGFAVRIDLTEIPPGPYTLRVGLAGTTGAAYLPIAIQIDVA